MESIKTNKAPKAIGPYSQGVKSNNLIFVSGQLPINIENGKLETEPKLATKASLSNVLEIINEAGGNINNIIKVNVYVKNINDFDEINKEYEKFFQGHKPARSLVEVSKLPKNAVLEIEAIASI